MVSALAAALGHQACRRGHDVAFTTCSRLLAHLAGGHADRSFEARVRKLAKVTVLMTSRCASSVSYELIVRTLCVLARAGALRSPGSVAVWV